MKKIKILFICKKRNDSYGISYGLVNSCKFIVNALEKCGIEGKIVSVVDNNCIDSEVHDYKPTHVFIEALWVVPSKFETLLSKYKKIKWYVRIHSKMPFIAHEGIAIEWLKEYYELTEKHHNFGIASNNMDMVESLKEAFHIHSEYYPNIYCPPEYHFHGHSDPHHHHQSDVLNIGCFGSIRPMKNQLYQAIAAISFGNEMDKKIRFHINSNRVEQMGDSPLKNIRSAFVNTQHELIEHEWVNHEDFIKLVRTMDLGLQVSFSETFNIVSADFVWNKIPVVGSNEIQWLNCMYKADPNCLKSIINKLHVAYFGKLINLHNLNLTNLKEYNEHSVKVWLDRL